MFTPDQPIWASTKLLWLNIDAGTPSNLPGPRVRFMEQYSARKDSENHFGGKWP
jgi:hypothetical protein